MLTYILAFYACTHACTHTLILHHTIPQSDIKIPLNTFYFTHHHQHLSLFSSVHSWT